MHGVVLKTMMFGLWFNFAGIMSTCSSVLWQEVLWNILKFVWCDIQQERGFLFLTHLFFFTVLFHKTAIGCEVDEYECDHPADGCIPRERMYDGKVDCLRGGDDENTDARNSIASQLFPEGNVIHLGSNQSVHDLISHLVSLSEQNTKQDGSAKNVLGQYTLVH